MILHISLELLLLILVMVYMILAIAVGFVRGWSYLKAHPDEKAGKAYHFHNERITYILAGFSLTAIALFLNIHLNPQIQTQLSSIILFFSIAFASLILSTIFIRFRIRNFALYLSDVLMNVGLLAISGGFLTFFADLPALRGSAIVFFVLFALLFSFSLLNYFLFDAYTKYWRDNQ